MKPLIISEMSGNHNGSIATACEIIRIASLCGCDAVKIQLYKPEDLGDPANNEIYEKCKIPTDWLPWLFHASSQHNIPLFASVFALWAVDEMEKYPTWGYKIASPESTRLPTELYISLRDAIKKTGKQLIASTGREDQKFMRTLQPDRLLYCVAGYPAMITDSDLSWFHDNSFNGFSDHTADIVAPLAMIGAGAGMIEKHFKLDDDCIDAAFSLDPYQMEKLCRIAHR